MPWDRSSSSDSRHILQMYSERKICFKISKSETPRSAKCVRMYSVPTHCFPSQSGHWIWPIDREFISRTVTKTTNSAWNADLENLVPNMVRTISGREGLWCRRNHLRFLFPSVHGHLETIPVRFYPFRNPSRDSLFANLWHEVSILRKILTQNAFQIQPHPRARQSLIVAKSKVDEKSIFSNSR